jgi:NADH-quinone oxidoreductase subunit A
MVFTWLHLAILVFFLVGVVFAGAPLLGSLLVAPRATGGDIGMPYECGMRPHGDSWMRFGINYYIYALLFLAFDVDVLYLFPAAAWYVKAQGLLPFLQLFVFVFFLIMAVIYFWAKGVFTWPKKIS